ncbi:MAG: nitrilase-related carbon-nitrogen hydrolase, partial [Lachnospiraceae bacterium]|nr:nitrilase-related carbon-nitrogen hydrolase [Lachnospiraceae bacterium]
MSLSKSGYIKAVAVHMKTSLGRPMENAKEIVRQAVHYTKNQADLIVFGELSISGYSCGDLFLQSFMEEQCRMAIAYLCDNLPQSDTLIAVGAPLRKDGMLFNTALIFKGNELLGIVPKTFVPNYKEFYEKRWFAGADQRFSDTIRYDEIFYDEGASLNGERTFPFTPNLIIEGRNGIRLACEICED